jgi:hypothetical protein
MAKRRTASRIRAELDINDFNGLAAETLNLGGSLRCDARRCGAQSNYHAQTLS